jgi:hypothetical protein
MGVIFSFIKKTSFYRFYNYDDSYFDSDEEDEYGLGVQYYDESNIEDLYDSRYNTYTGYSQNKKLPYYGEINSENLCNIIYKEQKDEENIGVLYKIKD